MKSVIIDKNEEKIELKGEKVYTKNHTIPTKLIDILILTESVSISPKTIINISNKNIPLLYLSKDSKKFALTLPAISKNSELKVMQYKALNQNIDISKRLIYEKFIAHQKSLKEFDIVIDISNETASLALAKDVDSIMGCEGAFARRYFGHYFSIFERKLTKGYRSKNPPQDPVNALLSYIYTLAYYSITAKLYMRGFDPSISYLHTPFRNHFALSSDLLEPLRADINNFVARLFLNQNLTTDDFTNKGGVYLKYNSRINLWKILKPFMNELNKKVNKQIIILKKEIIKKEI